MSILSDARIKVEYLEDYYRRREAGYHPECEPLAVSEAAAMLPEVLAYAERREMQAIEERARYLMTSNNDRAIYENIGQIKGNVDFMERAANELSADLSAWHKITEEEKAAIENTTAVLIDYGANCEIQIGDVAPLIEVLRGMIS